MYKCECGAEFKSRMRLKEHIGLSNPHWPRSSPDDKHKEIKAETQH